MINQPRRGVTRGYVVALVAATCVVAVALVVASWGVTSLAMSSDPVQSEGVAGWAAPALVIVTLGVFASLLWQQALVLLRGEQRPSLRLMFVAAAGSYLVWCIGGVAAGMTIGETWLSVYAVALAGSFLIANFGFWAVLVRRVYTDKPAPKWPWERAEENE